MNPPAPDFLHYSELEFCSLQRFSSNKAADLHAFHPDHEDPLKPSDLWFSSSDDDDEHDHIPIEDTEQLTATVLVRDKFVL